MYKIPLRHESASIIQMIQIPHEQKDGVVDISMEIFSDIRKIKDRTFVMNINTDINNDKDIYTDVNGLYIRKRSMDR